MLGRTTLALLLATAGCRQLFGLQLQSDRDAPVESGSDGSIPGTICNGDSLETPDGQMTACGWGCSTVGGAHCAQLVPAGGGVTSADLQPETGLTDVVVNATTIDDKGTISSLRIAGTGTISGIDFHVTNGVAIYRFENATFSGAIVFTGTLPIALVAIGTMTLAAVSFDVRGTCTSGAAGPGGFAGGAGGHQGAGAGGGNPGTSALEEGAGGGGGGFGAGGGLGASALGIETSGGVANGDAAMTTLGGGGGGGGGGSSGLGSGGGGAGGGGGGALQLVANDAMTIGGSINAGGCGGGPAGDDMEGGGGGGAGGALLIEAPTILFNGATLAVNGGGGGGEGVTRGQSGLTSRQPAQGGPPDGGDGGAGASLTGGNGGTPGGGGGGAVGRIRFETRMGMLAIVGATLSPSPADSPTTAVSAVAVTQ